MSTFKDYLNENDGAVQLATSLTRTLGRKLTQKGWSSGPRNSGIVAMGDYDSASVEVGVECVEAFLKNIDADEVKMKPGKLAGGMVVKYRGFLISVIDTGIGIKVTVS